MHRKWLINRTNPEYIRYLSKKASISPVLAQICINRGIKTPEEVSSFLNADVSHMSDPFDIQGMRKAVDRIMTAFKNGERILVHGDYDVDGLSATAIVIHALKILGIECSYIIPNRIEHGYGFNPLSVKKAKQIGATVIITVDCGITSFDTVDFCKREGIDVIITDHHEPFRNQKSEVRSQNEKSFLSDGFLLPDALAVINPKLSHPESHLSSLSGAGVALKLVQALSFVYSSRLTFYDFLDLAALGTLADVVSLTGENRLIVKEGLMLMNNGSRVGLKALKKVSGIDDRELKPGVLSFTLIPRINAAGRVSDATDVIELLLTESEDKAINLSQWVDRLNLQRQSIEEEVYKEAHYQITKKGVSPAIVLSSENWHQGVIGIVASRITEEFFRPSFIISKQGYIAKGSARSISSFHLYNALSQCSKFLKNFGGHKLAAGFELETKNIDAFEDCMIRIVQDFFAEKDLTPVIEIDAEVDFSDLHFGLIKELEKLEPFGSGNPEPLLGSKGLEVLSPRIVKDNHLKMRLRQGKYSFEAIGFDMGTFLSNLLENKTNSPVLNTIDAVFTPITNEWEGNKYLQLNLKAIRPRL